MELDKLQMLYKTAEFGSVKKAAESLGYTQSGLLYVINAVEQELGIPLLNRSYKGVTLSDTAIELQPYLSNLLHHQKLFDDKVDELSGKKASAIRIGALPSIAKFWLPQVICEFQKDHACNLQIFTGTDVLTEWLENDIIDLAIVEKKSAGMNKYTRISKDEVYAFIPKKYGIDPKPRISLKELEAYNVIIPNYYAKTEGSAFLKQWAEDRGIGSSLSVVSGDGNTLINLVNQDLGVTFLSAFYLPSCPDSAICIPLDPPIKKECGFIYSPNKTLTPLMKKFIRSTIRYIEKNGPIIDE